MANKRIRSYEVSVWTLQDSFITVLKPFNLENRDQIQDGKMTLKDDGTRELSFSIPMYLYDGNEKKENPLWYNTLNGNIIADLRKIKVIFNKNEREEKVFEFLITKVTERHEDEQLICEIDCEGLAFHELGKTGYRISLNQDDFLEEWANWFEAPNKEGLEEPKNNLKYWADKILKNTNWVSEICMDWAGYDGRVIVKYHKNTERVGDSDEEDSTYARIDIATVGDILLEQNNVAGTKMEVVSYEQLSDEEKEEVNNIRARNGLRLNNVIYEDGFVSSWDVQEEYKLVPTSVEKAREKYRVVNKEESNRYNLLMEVAEIFGVFCKFVYEYDGNYHIIKRKVIFYNNFLQEATGTIDLTYPYNTNHIEREMDGTDIITKMFVKPLQDDTFDSNWASITETEANRSLEDYLLNFDYLYQIGTITRQQYEEIPKYEAKMREFNEQLIELNNEVTILENELVELEANETFYGNAIKLDEERISAADDLLRALTNDTGVINITKDNPAIRAIISDGDNKYISLMEKGIKESSVEVYADSECTTKITHHVESSCYDSANNLEKIYVTPTTSEKQAYLIYVYEPRLYYENIRAMWQRRLIEDENNYNNAKNRADTIGGTERDRDGNRTGGIITNIHISIDELLEEKQKTIDAFERMMGPALREGSWQPEDDYARYGDKRNSEFSLGLEYKDFNDDEVSIGWDTVPFDEERKNYYEVGADKIHKYYPCIDLSSYLNRFIRYDDQEGIGIDDLVWNKLSFIYYDINTEDEPIDGEIPISKARFFGLNSQCEFAFLKNENNIIPVLMITGVESIPLDEESEWTIDIKDPTRKGQIGYYQVEIDENNNIKESIQSIVSDIEVYDEVHDVNAWIEHPENYTIVYPRIKFKNNKLHTSEDEFIIKLNGSVISNYQNYSLLTRDDGNDDSPSYNYYATIKNNTLIREGAFSDEEGAKINLAYAFSNTSLPIYLDAIQVLKENAFPRVEYTIDPTLTNPYFSHIAYDTLNKIVHINDDELKFENVLGYISELELDLDHPWEDSIKITNYKTKFEDLFSSIVASTEEMKKNSYIVGMAAKAFTTTGELNTDLMQGAVNDLNLKYAFDKGNLTIDSKEGIWGSSEDGVVAFRGGGIFTANQKDENGEWVWNTGILPQGINASAITTGRLDTNLIRVYAGDDLRLQMNADGLVAYRDMSGENAEQVIHNKDGLFLRAQDSNEELFDKVSLTWDGLTIKNNDGMTVFNADDEGNLKISGELGAASLHILDGSSNTIGNIYLNGNEGLYIESVPESNAEYKNYFQANGEIMGFYKQLGNEESIPLLHYSDGNLYLSGSIISDTKLGEIGHSWEITDDGHLKTSKTISISTENTTITAPIIDFYSGDSNSDITPYIKLYDNNGNILFDFSDGQLLINSELNNNLNSWLNFSGDGLKIGQTSSSYYSLTNSNGFHIMQNQENVIQQIASFNKDNLLINEIAIGNIKIKIARDNGLVFTSE